MLHLGPGNDKTKKGHGEMKQSYNQSDPDPGNVKQARHTDDHENDEEDGAQHCAGRGHDRASNDRSDTAPGRLRFLGRQPQPGLQELNERRDQRGEVLAQAAVTSRMAERYRAARQPVP